MFVAYALLYAPPGEKPQEQTLTEPLPSISACVDALGPNPLSRARGGLLVGELGIRHVATGHTVARFFGGWRFPDLAGLGLDVAP